MQLQGKDMGGYIATRVAGYEAETRSRYFRGYFSQAALNGLSTLYQDAHNAGRDDLKARIQDLLTLDAEGNR